MNTPRRIAVALSKGGVGKTTTAVNLAHALALAGERVLLVDCDTQGHVATLLGMTPSVGIGDVIENPAMLTNAIVQARHDANSGGNLFLIAGGDSLAGLDSSQLFRLPDLLRGAEHGFSYVLLDTGPGWDNLTLAVLQYANEILSPVSLEALTLRSLVAFRERIGRARTMNDTLSLRYILPTFQDGRVRKSAEVLEQLREAFPDEVCDPIRYSSRLSESAGWGETVFEYAPGSSGAIDYEFLSQRIISNGKA